MLPNLLDDLLRAWDTHPPGSGSVQPNRTESQPQQAVPEGAGEAVISAPEAPQAPAEEILFAESSQEVQPPHQVTESRRIPSFIEPPQTLLPADPFGTFLAIAQLEMEETAAAQEAPAITQEAPAIDKDGDDATSSVMDSLLSSLLANFDEPAAPDLKPIANAACNPPPKPKPAADSPAFAFRAKVPAASLGRKYVAVAMGNHKFALPIESVLEVGRRPKVTYVPGMAPHVEGVFSFRGEVVPVVNVSALGQGAGGGSTAGTEPESMRIVAVQTSNGRSRAALVFDSLEGIVSLDSDAPGRPHIANLGLRDSHPLAGMLTGVCNLDSSQFGLISIDRLLEDAGCTEGSAAR